MSAAPLYQQLMGQRFDALPAAVQAFHRLQGRHELPGWVRTEAPASLLARCLAFCLGAPRQASSGAIRFELDAQAGREIWTRHFPGKTMRSTLSRGPSGLTEQLGLARLGFELWAGEGRLEMRLRRVHFLGIPCPAWLMPQVVAIETGDADRLQFEVRATVPVIGRVASYSGHLLLPREGAAG